MASNDHDICVRCGRARQDHHVRISGTVYCDYFDMRDAKMFQAAPPTVAVPLDLFKRHMSALAQSDIPAHETALFDTYHELKRLEKDPKQ